MVALSGCPLSGCQWYWCLTVALSVWVSLSAGVGRTGTYIALDIACNRKSRGLDVCVHGIVSELREQRSIMVQTQVGL